MFSKQLLRSSRAASRRLLQTPRTQQIASPSLRIASQSRLQPIASQYLSRRWQSTDAQTSESASAEGDAKAAAPEDALKQEVEKQKKEIIDLKVRILLYLSTMKL